MENFLNNLRNQYQQLEKDLADDSIINDQERYQATAKKFADLTPLIKSYDEYQTICKEIADVEELLSDDSLDEETRHFYEEEQKTALEKKMNLTQQLEEMILAEEDPNKDRNAIVEIRAGTGGEEAALFAGDLYRMYTKYAQAQGFKIEPMSVNETGLKGIKEVIFVISGQGCYRKFHFESGTHRVQRVPETESQGRIHTSAVTVAVLPEAEEVEVEIEAKDLRIDVYRSSGPGGQSVNTTDSAVRITHVPTGLVVTCQDEKSQHKNKAKAMRILRARLFEKIQEEQHQDRADTRKQQVGSGDRSERIRTYNFPEKRVTDHRIGLTLHSLDQILEGDLTDLITGLEKDDREKKLKGLTKDS